MWTTINSIYVGSETSKVYGSGIDLFAGVIDSVPREDDIQKTGSHYVSVLFGSLLSQWLLDWLIDSFKQITLFLLLSY